MGNITKETFKEMSVASKLNILFDCVLETNNKLEGYKLRTVFASFTGGIIGGIITIISRWVFWK